MPRLLLYCTKSKSRLFFDKLKQIFSLGKIKSNNDLNGKIVAECDFEVEEIQAIYINEYVYDLYHSFYRIQDDKKWLDKTCLNMAQLDNYLKGKNGYAIHIKNLHIFDEPKELDDYYYSRKGVFRTLGNAPQNMMYAQEVVPFKEEHLIKGVLQEFRGNRVNKYILISIQPQWLCKILNGEKTIEVRKKVLKEMLD